MSLKGKYKFISYCGKNYCALCSYYQGTIVKAASKLLTLAETHKSLRLIADHHNVCNFDEFMRGLRWFSNQKEPCKGCRFGGGWSWWPDCPTRNCCQERGFDFCFQCEDFPCSQLTKGPLLERKMEIIAANTQLKSMGISEWFEALRNKYRRALNEYNRYDLNIFLNNYIY